MSKRIQFSDKQRLAMTWWAKERFADYDAIICDGAIRSGKTLAMGLGFFFWAMKSFDRRKFGICGRTITTLRHNLISEILPYLRRVGFECEEKRSENLVTVRHGGKENYFYLYGGGTGASAPLIQGITLAGVLFDEAALLQREFVEQACARCSVTGSRLWFNCNPEGPQHWFYRDWILRAKQRHILRLHFTMEDNPSLSERIRKRYARSYSGTFYRRFILGEWTEAEGRIYDFYDTQRDPSEPPEGDAQQYRVSVDYGTVNPTSFGLWGLYDGVWYRVAEYYFDSRREGRQKTDAEYVRDLKTFVGGRAVERVIVDPSAASFIEALRREGIRTVRANNDVVSGLRVTADLLKNKSIVICRGCENCLREIADYCWASDGDRDKPRKENDHAMDEMRYFAMTVNGGGRDMGMAVRCVERRA